VRERALHDEASLMRQEREKGRAEGVIEGKAEGVIEGRAEGVIEGRAEGVIEGTAKGLQRALSRLVESGMDEEQARRILGL
jgi:flagellar biosynthesis/type III secretory pathway protein FliH